MAAFAHKINCFLVPMLKAGLKNKLTIKMTRPGPLATNKIKWWS